MRIIAVDDEEYVLQAVEGAIREAVPDCELEVFAVAEDALRCARETEVDAAFLDINMGDMNGLELAAALKEINAKTGVIFVTGYGQYMDDAFSMHCSGYVMKPVSAKDVEIELTRLRHNPPDAPKLPERVGAFTFDHGLRRVYKSGNDLVLTPTEYNILLKLAECAGAFVSTDELYEKTVGMKAIGDYRALYVQVHGLRKHLGLDAPGAGIELEHKRGKGYRLVVK